MTELPHRYAALVDARDWDGAAALFAEDGELVVKDVTHAGRTAIRAAIAELESQDSTRHDITGVDDEGQVTCVAHHVTGDRCVDWHVRYVDSYDGELFRRRELRIDRIEVHEARAAGSMAPRPGRDQG